MKLFLISIILAHAMNAHTMSELCRYNLSKFIGSQKNYIIDYRDGDLAPHEINYAISYWRHVHDIYGGRLKLSEKEIGDFVHSSMDSIGRTILVTNQKHSKDKFDGGVALVYSDTSSDKLPFEIATNLSFPRDGLSIEITRLTADHAEDKLLGRELLATVAKILESEGISATMYAFTSKRHAILYKRSRIPYTQYIISDRDVVLKFSSENYIKAFLHTTKRKF